MIMVLIPERKHYHDDLDAMQNALVQLAESLNTEERKTLIEELKEKEHFIYDMSAKRFYNADEIFRYLASQIEKDNE